MPEIDLARQLNAQLAGLAAAGIEWLPRVTGSPAMIEAVAAIASVAAAPAEPAPGVVSAILEADAVIICPSNPFISIGPILAVPGLRDALRETRGTVVAITPIIVGKALKGPAADMLRDLGHEVSASAVAELYQPTTPPV